MIEKMQLKDINRVTEMEQVLFPIGWKRDDFIYELTGNPYASYMVIKQNGTIIGYIGTWLIDKQGHITNLGVDRTYQHQGYGEQLLDYALNYLKDRGGEECLLEVRESNVIAKNLYEKKGFEAFGIRKNYYQDNYENAIVMRKEL